MSRQLFVCHIEPQGQYPHMKYDADNAWAGCYRCHIHWAHKNPREVEEWLVRRLGSEARAALALRTQNAKRIDPDLTRLMLEAQLTQLQCGSSSGRSKRY
jgi:hypothetical protein